ncbi:MAG: 7TM diverse intracellular signaling domain-containing protein [Flavobacteriales bacterium]
MRFCLLSLFFLVAGSLRADAPGSIPLEEDLLGQSIADSARYLKDPSHRLTIDSILQKDLSSRFRPPSSSRANLGFTSATIWVEGSFENRMPEQKKFLLEASRPLTNLVKLYVVRDGQVTDTMVAGDHQPFHERPLPSRKNVFPVRVEPGEKIRFILELRSDGESLVFPLIIWTPSAFFAQERLEQWHDGFFYGIFVFVFLIFSFFYRALRDPSFLYYVLYILCFGLLQFSIDGYGYRAFFRDSPWMADRILLFSSSLTIFMLLLYAQSYLKVMLRSPKLYQVYRVLMGIALLLFGISFLPVSIAKYCNPALNLFSFLAVIFVLASIFFFKKRGYSVSNLFMTAYVLLITGAIVFILGNTGVLESGPVTLNALKYGGLGEVIFLSFTMAEKYRSIQREKELAQKESLEQMEELNRVKDEYNQRLEREVEERTRDLEREREKLDAINREMVSSIRYAERIQRAILPPDKKFDQLFRDWFVLFQPRDIVSGDIYWCSAESGDVVPEEKSPEDSEGIAFSGLSMDPLPSHTRKKLFSVMDCTGHGVPGAFLTFLGQSILTKAKQEAAVKSPAQALSHIDRELKATLTEIQAETQVQDGMDMGLCNLDKETLELHFAGAGHDCYIVRQGEAYVLKGDRQGIGGDKEGSKTFTDQPFQLQKGDMIYLFSDGYPDQFGGPNKKKFKYRPFRELLLSLSEQNLELQKEELENTLQEWKGELEQVDDICVMGIRV